ncbi:uncharacterized protein LOC131063190 [Cryptomeria japonica]|uniref:uncharacterized protein LOC131063190 n=1 Tax=Cryptomeria japonica TaxID=3369 RepID=UPI0027DA40DC|nr:uncharacterized protein LOC131063190 [Cryptomeria japonica]
MTSFETETLISEGHDRAKIEQKVKILEAQRKEEMKQKRKLEREAKKVAQATPNVVSITIESLKQPEAPSGEPASPKLKESVKRKQKPARQYMTVSSEETEPDDEIKQDPKRKGAFARVVREKKEEQKKQPEMEPPQKTPKITIVHKQKPKDVDTKVENEKGTKDKVSDDAPKVSEAPSGKDPSTQEMGFPDTNVSLFDTDAVTNTDAILPSTDALR